MIDHSTSSAEDSAKLESTETVTFEQIKGTIGTMVWLWSDIERELRRSLHNLNKGKASKKAHGISRSLNIWSEHILSSAHASNELKKLTYRITEYLEEALVVRNLMCHGLLAAYAKFHSCERDAYLHVELGDNHRDLTWTELQNMISWMSRVNYVVRDITYAATEPDPESQKRLIVPWEAFPELN